MVSKVCQFWHKTYLHIGESLRTVSHDLSRLPAELKGKLQSASETQAQSVIIEVRTANRSTSVDGIMLYISLGC